MKNCSLFYILKLIVAEFSMQGYIDYVILSTSL